MRAACAQKRANGDFDDRKMRARLFMTTTVNNDDRIWTKKRHFLVTNHSPKAH